MAEPSKGGIKKDGQTRGGTSTGRKYVKTERKGSVEQRKDKQKETNSKGDKPRVKAGSGKGGSVAPRKAPSPPSGGKQVPAARSATGTKVGGLAGKIAPRAPTGVTATNPGAQAPQARLQAPQGVGGAVSSTSGSTTPAKGMNPLYSTGQPSEGMRTVGSGQTDGARASRGPASPDMRAGPRPGMSAPGALGLGRFAGPLGAAASVMAPSETNAGEDEWLAANKHSMQPSLPPQQQQQGQPGQAVASPLPNSPNRVLVLSPSMDHMAMGSFPHPSAGPREQQPAPQRQQAASAPPQSLSRPAEAPQERSSPSRPSAPPARAKASPASSQRPTASRSRDSGLSVDTKVKQLVDRGFSREDAMKLATAQGGKVNAPAGYKGGGLVKVNKTQAPGMPRMPKMPATGKAATKNLVNKAKPKMPSMKKMPKPKKGS